MICNEAIASDSTRNAEAHGPRGHEAFCRDYEREIWALVVAAGRGERMGAPVNKVFLGVAGVPVLVRTLLAFERHPGIHGIALVYGPGEAEICQRFLREFGISKVEIMAEGGATRQQSVARGLGIMPRVRGVLVHDGARCMVTPEVISRCIDGVADHGSAVAAVPVKDTVKMVADGQVTETLDRTALWAMQTPQAFRYSELAAAYERAEREGWQTTDDAAVMEKAGHRVRLCAGDENNFKLTTPEDLLRAEGLLGGARMRIGLGYDAHKLTEGRKLILGGVEVPHEWGLLGHSDADVLAHAVMDALLGAAKLGDIGKLFPDSDERYRGISSLKLMREVGELLRRAGYEIGNVDATIIAQRPKLAPYREAMEKNMAEALDVDGNRISVKATTTEKMGFAGREEGIAAEAVALITGGKS